MVSLHHHAGPPIDWPGLLADPAPAVPTRSSVQENEAAGTMAAYTPSFFARTLKFEGRQRRALEKKVELARESDDAAFVAQQKEYAEHLSEWQQEQEMAKGVLSKDLVMYKAAVDYFEPFTEVADFGISMHVEMFAGYALANLMLQPAAVVPTTALSQTSTGKLSRKALSASRSNGLTQEFACSAAIRVARELFACLPFDLVVVNILANILDPSTGKSGDVTLLSVAFTRKGLAALEFEHVEPVAALRNFTCNMKFSKTTGFTGVGRIDPATLLLH